MNRRSSSGRNGDPTFDYLNRPVHLPVEVRVAMAVILLLFGALLLLIVGVLMFGPHRTPFPNPVLGLLIAILVAGLGCGLLVVGARLLRPGVHSGMLIGPSARTICGLFFGAAAVGMGMAGWAADGSALAVQAVCVAFFSFLIFRSATRNSDE